MGGFIRGILMMAGLAGLISCGGGAAGGSGSGSFRLIEFLEHGQNQIPRNRVLTFLFSAPVAPGQDFAERLKIQNVQTGAGSNFSLAIGTYDVSGDRVVFAPRLPNQQDRSDAGFRENGKYTVFLKAGQDALASDEGDRIAVPQESNFFTNQYFEDPIPAQPPRVGGFFARDVTQPVTAPRTDLSRLDPRPNELALMDNAALIDSNRFLEPGAGASFQTPWRFELQLSEPIDPITVSTDNIQLLEIYADATTSGDAAPPFAPAGYRGTAVNFKVPITVSMDQRAIDLDTYDVRLVVTPLFALVDNTRYRLVVSGNVLGIDFRQEFIGANGVTGDGETVLSGGMPYPEPGGLGYTTEFIVRDRPAISSVRTLTYDPIADGIKPELGQTAVSKNKLNTALYNPASSPSTAVGYLAAFGNGADGNLTASTGVVTVDTGDTPNPPVGKPFNVWDLNPQDNYNANTLPGANRTYDSRQPFELNLAALTVATGATLRFIGVNPVLLRVTGISQISGTIDLAGGDGQNGGNPTANAGTAGPAGGIGGRSRDGPNGCGLPYGTYQSCSGSNFSYVITSCGTGWPWSLNGQGPGRGHAGGSAGGYGYWSPTSYIPQSGTGGGGGSRGTSGAAGSDLTSQGAGLGSPGNCAGPNYTMQNSSVVGVRGMPGTVHGDAELFDVTWGGSGGGAGGATTTYSSYNTNQAGGAGGGGGGMFTLACAGPIFATGGRIDVTGGDGGAGGYRQYSTINYIFHVSGGGGGGSGGNICLISGDNIVANNALFDARGGNGGAAPSIQAGTCPNCNAGGRGGNGFIFLMDADGVIPGLLPGTTGTYPAFSTGYLTIAPLAQGANRFGDIRAITELFNALAANPAYAQIDESSDILANVAQGQEILVYLSSAKADPANPLVPSVASEISPVLVARVHFALGAAQVDADTFMAMDQLNPTGPNRDAFLRVDAFFNYGALIVQAALGPFMSMDRMDIRYTFNG